MDNPTTHRIPHPTDRATLVVSLDESDRYNPQPGRYFVRYRIEEERDGARTLIEEGDDYSPSPLGPIDDLDAALGLLSLASAPHDDRSGAYDEDAPDTPARRFWQGHGADYLDEAAMLAPE